MALTVDFALMKNESNLPELSLERCSVMSIRCSLFIVCWIIHFSRDVIPLLSRDVPMLLLICDASSKNFESRKNVETFSDVIIAEVLTQSMVFQFDSIKVPHVHLVRNLLRIVGWIALIQKRTCRDYGSSPLDSGNPWYLIGTYLYPNPSGTF